MTLKSKTPSVSGNTWHTVGPHSGDLQEPVKLDISTHIPHSPSLYTGIAITETRDHTA
jgi:hypothetical protein